MVDKSLWIYAHGSLWEIFGQRARDVWFQYSHPVDSALHIFFVFLLGLYAGQRKLFGSGAQSHKVFLSAWYFGLLFGIGGHVLRYFLPRLHTHVFVNLGPSITVISDLALAAFYLASLILAMNNTGIAKLLSPLASVGRMTLTNYLCQSLICTSLMYSYGFGLYGRVRPLDWLALTSAIYGIQVLVSVWWLRRFAYGPAEWLWRTLVYGKRLPMHLQTSGASLH